MEKQFIIISRFMLIQYTPKKNQMKMKIHFLLLNKVNNSQMQQ